MAKAKRIEGFNEKEQLIFSKLHNGNPCSFRELKMLFMEEATNMCKLKRKVGVRDVDMQAQSFARNSIRRLIRDEWVEQTGRGTYRLTKIGQKRITKGITTTISSDGRRGRKPRKVKMARGRPVGTSKKAIVKVAKKKIVVAKAKILRTTIEKETKKIAKVSTKKPINARVEATRTLATKEPKKTAKVSAKKMKAVHTRLLEEMTLEEPKATKKQVKGGNNKSKTKKALALMAKVAAEQARIADADAAE